jgi:hypothetical protein
MRIEDTIMLMATEEMIGLHHVATEDMIGLHHVMATGKSLSLW